MTAVFGSASVAGFPTGATAFTVTKPSDLAVGDLMTAACMSNNGSATYTAPAGWSHATGSPESVVGCATFVKIADAADVAAVDFAFVRGTNAAGAGGVVLVRWAGALSVADVNATSGSGTSLTLQQVTATDADTLLAHLCLKVTTTAGAFGTPPGSASLRASGTASGTALTYAIADEAVGSGATGTRAWTYTGSSASRGTLVAINPSTAPPEEGSGTGTWTFTGTASGEAPPNTGAATGTVAWTGSASGEAPPNQGAAVGSTSWAGSADGISEREGSALGAVAWSGTAVGSVEREGTASGDWAYAGSAVGASVRSGDTLGAVAWSGTAQGQQFPEGNSLGDWVFAGTAVGAAPPDGGVASGSWGFSGTANGTNVIRDITVSGRLLSRTVTGQLLAGRSAGHLAVRHWSGRMEE